MKSGAGRPIALVGLMGAGKSAVAAALGERLGGAVADLDAMVEAAAGRGIADIFARDGEAAFRRLEGVALREALAAGAAVLACGGGIVLDALQRRTLVDRCRVAWLEVEPATAAARLAGEAAVRPLLAGVVGAGPAQLERRLTELLAGRRELYAQIAAVRVTVDGLGPDEVADAVLRELGEAGR
jgi:shikimate kinase